MCFGNLSKVVRGYCLFLVYFGDEVKLLVLVNIDSCDSVEFCFIYFLEYGLFYWYNYEQIYIECDLVLVLYEIKYVISFLC